MTDNPTWGAPQPPDQPDRPHPTEPHPTEPHPTEPHPTEPHPIEPPYGGADPYGAPGAPPQPPDAAPYDPYGGDVLATAEPRPRRGVLIGVASALLVLVAGAGVFVATRLSGGGLQPEALTPANAFGFVKFDLDPAAGQKLAVREFASHFPSAPKAEADGIFDAFVAEALSAGGDVDYARDVEPWLGKRVAIAGFTDAEGDPVGVGILQTSDEAKAREGLGRLAEQSKREGEPFAWRIDRGYAVVASDLPTVDAAIAAAEKESLDGNERYRDDLEMLSEDQVLTGWADLERSFAAMRGADPRLGSLPNAITDQFKGRVVVGGHAANDYVEIEGYVLDAPQAQQLRNAAPSLLTGLPAETVAALSVTDLDKAVKQQLEAVEAMGLDPDVFLGQLAQGFGVDVENDLLPLLGKQAVVALGTVPFDISEVEVGLRSEVTDPAKARTTGDQLAAAAARFELPLEARVDGNVFTLAFGDGYAGKLASGKGLGSSPTFRKAMGELGDEVAVAAYVDIAAIVAAMPAEERDADMAALRAFGLSAGRRDGDGYFRMRLVVHKG